MSKAPKPFMTAKDGRAKADAVWNSNRGMAAEARAGREAPDSSKAKANGKRATPQQAKAKEQPSLRRQALFRIHTLKLSRARNSNEHRASYQTRMAPSKCSRACSARATASVRSLSINRFLGVRSRIHSLSQEIPVGPITKLPAMSSLSMDR